MQNLSFDSPFFIFKTRFLTSLAIGLFVSGCQSMPWTQNNSTTDVTPSTNENPSTEVSQVAYQEIPEEIELIEATSAGSHRLSNDFGGCQVEQLCRRSKL